MVEFGRRKGETKREVITFFVGIQEFCVDVMAVREIRVWMPVTPLVHAPSFVCGMLNLRGTILPIIDFASRLGLPSSEPTSRHAILVVETANQVVGLLVEGVSEILTISQNMIQPTPDVASQMAKEFVSGVVAVDQRMISLISLVSILPQNEQSSAA
jgi:purine-binding chemotaxis protein CheW